MDNYWLLWGGEDKQYIAFAIRLTEKILTLPKVENVQVYFLEREGIKPLNKQNQITLDSRQLGMEDQMEDRARWNKV